MNDFDKRFDRIGETVDTGMKLLVIAWVAAVVASAVTSLAVLAGAIYLLIYFFGG